MQFTRTKELPALYCRVSSEEQRERQTILTQVEFGRSYARLHGMEFSGLYQDDGVSGTIPLEHRPEGARLLADARAGRVRSVYVYRLDRVGRDPRGILNAVAALDEAGCTVVSMTEPFDTESPAGRFMLSMLAAVAGFERDSLLSRSLAGRDRKARDGCWVGGKAPFGYRLVGEPHQRRIEPDEAPIPGTDPPRSPADVMRLMFQLCAEEKLTCQQIVERLNALRIPAPAFVLGEVGQPHSGTGRPISGLWHDATVRRYLRATTYKGVHQHGRWKGRKGPLIERDVPALVSDEVWDAAQEVLTDNQRYPPGRPIAYVYLLSGLMRCGGCGSRYSGKASVLKTRTYRYYVCHSRHNRPKFIDCHYPRLPIDPVDTEVWERVQAMMADPGAELRRLAEQQRHTQDPTPSLREQLAQLTSRLEGLGAERQRVVNLYRRGLIDDATADYELQSVDREEQLLRVERERLTEHLNTRPADRTLERALELILDTRHLSDQREVVKKLVRQIVVGEDRRLEIHWRFWAE